MSKNNAKKFSKNNLKSNVTFIIFTYNEEKRIEEPIKSFLPYGDVIISDNFSTDKTVKIAKKLGAKVIPRYRKGFVENKKEVDFIFKNVKTDWVFWGFADTMVPKTCLELYSNVSNNSKYKLVVQKCKNFLYSSKTEYFPHNITIRFFKKDSMDFSSNTILSAGQIASHVKPDEVLYLPPLDEYSIYHFSTDTTEAHMNKINSYSTQHAYQTQVNSTKFLVLRLIFKLFTAFINYYFLQGSFKYGLRGYFVSVQYAFYYLIFYSKIYEQNNKLNINSIEKDFIKLKKDLLVKSPKSNFIKKFLAKVEIAFISRLHKKLKVKQIS